MSEQLYKVLNENRRPIHGGNGQWLPAGEWMPPIENIVLCERGYHVCNREELVLWLGPAIWTVETRGEHAEANDKQVWSEARLVRKLETWNSRTQRLFASDCAEHVLHLFEQERPDDTRPRRSQFSLCCPAFGKQPRNLNNAARKRVAVALVLEQVQYALGTVAREQTLSARIPGLKPFYQSRPAPHLLVVGFDVLSARLDRPNSRA